MTTEERPWTRSQDISATASSGWEKFGLTTWLAGRILSRAEIAMPEKLAGDPGATWLDIYVDEYVGITGRAKHSHLRLEEEAMHKLYQMLHAKFGGRDSEERKPLSEIAAAICRDVAELPDRDSPPDWPEAMLVTADELKAIVERDVGPKE